MYTWTHIITPLLLFRGTCTRGHISLHLYYYFVVQHSAQQHFKYIFFLINKITIYMVDWWSSEKKSFVQKRGNSVRLWVHSTSSVAGNDFFCRHCRVLYFYQIMTYFNSLKIMSLNCDVKKEEAKEKKKYNKKISLKICTKQGVNLGMRCDNGRYNNVTLSPLLLPARVTNRSHSTYGSSAWSDSHRAVFCPNSVVSGWKN